MPSSMAGALFKIGRGCARHPWWVLGVWLLALGVLVFADARLDGQPSTSISLPGTSAQQGADILDSEFPGQSAVTGQVVLNVSGAFAPAQVAATSQVIAGAGRLAGMQSVTDPFSPTSPDVSPDGTTAVIDLTYDPSAQLSPQDYTDLQQAMAPLQDAGVTVSYGGGAAEVAETSQPDYSELYGLGAAVVILLLVFGSILGMVTTLGTALVAVATATTTIKVLMATGHVSQIGLVLATMIGLGVGIDYSLFVVTRHRNQVAAGHAWDESAGLALSTAGHAVVFAGITVVVALSGLFMSGIPFVGILGATAGVGVLTGVLAALTLLPALLGIWKGRIDRVRLPWVRQAHEDSAAGADGRFHGWARWAHLVSRRPWMFLVCAVVLLGALAAPLLRIHLGQVDAGDDPPGSTTRQAYDTIAAHFGPGFNAPIIVVVTDPDSAVLAALSQRIGADPDVAAVAPAVVSKTGEAAMLTVVPRTGPKDPKTQALVGRMSGGELDEATAGTGAEVYVTGFTASLVELTDRLGARLAWFILAVVAISFLLLMFGFRSLVIPASAAVMNLISIGAAYGVVVAMFEWGWAKGLIGLPETVEIVAYVPMMMFAILFGLSMDYEVFLLSRIAEAHGDGAANRDAVVAGVSSTARVISAAALIMVSVFLSFVTQDDVVVKMMGVGLATAVLVDATIVRLLLVPSVMTILGRANWWLPAWMERILPRISFEGGAGAAAGPRHGPVRGAPHMEPFPRPMRHGPEAGDEAAATTADDMG